MGISGELLNDLQRLTAERRLARAARLLRDASADHPQFAEAAFHAAAAGAVLSPSPEQRATLLAVFRDDERRLAALFAAVESLGPGDPWSAAIRDALWRIGIGDADGRRRLHVVLEQSGIAPTMSLGDALPRLLDRSVADGRLPAATESVAVVDDAVGPLGCAYLRDAAVARGLRPALVLDPVTGERRPHPHRTSSSAQLPRGDDDPLAEAIVHRLAGLAGLPASHVEPLAILHYLPGQEYRPHGDWLPSATAADASHLAQYGQRTHTVLLYLNTPDGGGELHFPARDETIAAREGRAVCFRNTDDAGRPLEASLHASMPVTAGDKWAASLWFRSRPIGSR